MAQTPEPTGPRTSMMPDIEPELLLEHLLQTIASNTGSRWDQWARYHAGDEAADRLIAWLEERGIRPYRGR